MKPYLSLILFLLVLTNCFSQEVSDSASVKKTKINRWSVDVAFGSSRGIRPYNDGYFSTENDKVLGELNLNSISFGARYYINKYVTFKSDLAFDRFIPTNNKSLDFDVAQFRLSVQTMFNINSIFGLKETSRFKLLPHIGMNIASLKTIKSSQNQTIGSPDYIIGVIYGFSPMYNISKKAALFLDVSLINNFRQHHTWDGNVSDEKNNLSGQMSNISLGISYKLGKPIDPANEEIKKLEEAKNDELEKRVAEIESKLIDTDKDGVTDNLDQENNSIEGAVVDSKGVMIDKNNNNIPDEIEKYLEKNTPNSTSSISNNSNPTNPTNPNNSNPNNSNPTNPTNLTNQNNPNSTSTNNSVISKSNQTSNGDFFKKAINDGYICVFFETNKAAYISSSKDSINYILTFLNTNPELRIDIIGYTDEIGKSNENQQLSLDRANNVKTALISLGIDASRLNVMSGGEDQTYNPSSEVTRSMVRKVIFRVK